jgi:hypothetical protein
MSLALEGVAAALVTGLFSVVMLYLSTSIRLRVDRSSRISQEQHSQLRDAVETNTASVATLAAVVTSIQRDVANLKLAQQKVS